MQMVVAGPAQVYGRPLGLGIGAAAPGITPAAWNEVMPGQGMHGAQAQGAWAWTGGVAIADIGHGIPRRSHDEITATDTARRRRLLYPLSYQAFGMAVTPGPDSNRRPVESRWHSWQGW